MLREPVARRPAHAVGAAATSSCGRAGGRPASRNASAGRCWPRWTGRSAGCSTGCKRAGLDERTLVIFTSDNGPLPTFGGTRTGGLRGSKLSLYEGGIRVPFIARWPGHVPGRAGRRADRPRRRRPVPDALCQLAGATLPQGAQARRRRPEPAALLGKPPTRTKPLFWEYGRNDNVVRLRRRGATAARTWPCATATGSCW